MLCSLLQAVWTAVRMRVTHVCSGCVEGGEGGE